MMIGLSTENTMSYASQLCNEKKFSNEEKEWVLKVIEHVKNQKNINDLKAKLSEHYLSLNNFEPEKIVNLVLAVNQEVNSSAAKNYKILTMLAEKAAEVIIHSGTNQFKSALKANRQGYAWLAVYVALSLAKKGKNPLLLIKNYQIPWKARTFNNKNAIIALAKEATIPSQLLDLNASKLGKLGLEVHSLIGQKILSEIAKLSAMKNGKGISRCIQSYSIDSSTMKGQKKLIEIAKLAAQQDGSRISEYIKNYGIDNSTPEGQKALIEIAKLAVQQSGFGTTQYIQNYGIDTSKPEGQKALIEIAMMAAKFADISLFIGQYGIGKFKPDGQKALIEIAKLAAQRFGESLSQNIYYYGIDSSTPEGQMACVEIAKLAAQQNGGGASNYIKNYRIDPTTSEGQSALIEIAKLAAQQNGGGTSAHIQNYGIDKTKLEGQSVLIDIAKIAAQNNGKATSYFIKNYGINTSTPEGQKAVIEIAKLAAQNDGGTSEHIQNYGIDPSSQEGTTALIEIAKLAAQQNGWATSNNIQKYGIDPSLPEGQKALIEIAKLAALQNAWGTTQNINNFDIDKSTLESQKAYEDLSNYIFLSLIKQQDFFSEGIIKFKFNLFYFSQKLPGDGLSTYAVEMGEKFLNFCDELKPGNCDAIAEECLDLVAEQFKMSIQSLIWVQESLKKNEQAYIKIRFLKWYINLAALCSMRKDLRDLFKTQQKTVLEISKQNPILREALAKEFIYLSSGRNTERWERLKTATDNIVHADLAALVFANFPSEGENVYRQALKVLKSEREFREAKHQKLLLECLLKIKNSTLEGAKKARLIELLFKMPIELRCSSIRLVSDLLAFKGESYIQETCDLKALKMGLEGLFKMQFNVNIDEFSTRYETTVGSWRNKEAMATYAGKLNELAPYEKAQAFPLFNALLKMILDGSFQKARYATDKNPHLEEIRRNHLTVFENWQLKEQLNPAEIEIDSDEEEVPVADRIVNTLKEALVQNHLGGDNQSILYPILSGCIGKWDNLEESLLKIEKLLVPLSNRRLLPKEKEEKLRLLIQKDLLNLLNNSEDLEKKLSDLKSHLPEEMEFHHDMESSLKLLQAEGKSQSKTYQVIDTDDPNHFLLMGTDVENSCQRIDGSANLNKCLLSYFLDGKHRLSLVCDARGKILARSVLRLLIDARGQPVLFQEKMYMADTTPAYQQLLRKLALKKAANLGIPLVASKADFKKEKGRPYPYVLYAKEKPVPFEYVDALGNIQAGPYFIDDAVQLN